jgi:tRNA dimethylallyltransferase
MSPKSASGPISAVLIAGPTASGKSNVALALAQRLGGTIINADAMQVYDGLRVLTARPSTEDEARVPHKLYGTVPASTAFTVGDWTEAATKAARKVTEAGRLPIFVGGTGMYLSVLSDGISPMPEIPADIRKRVRAMGLEDLYDQVEGVDAASASRIGATDPQRLMRALEVFEATGEPLTSWQERPKVRPFAGKFARIVLAPDRLWVYERIEQRIDDMVTSGALEEVADLARRGLDPELPLMKALGVPELLGVQRGEMALDEAVVALKTKTRRFAKRQMTWFRNQMVSWKRVQAQEMETIINDSFAIILSSGLTLPK